MKGGLQIIAVSAILPTLVFAPGIHAQALLSARPQPAAWHETVTAVPAQAVRQTIYVPVYSYIYFNTTAQGSRRRFPLTITLSIQNTDLHRPLVVTSARYYDQGGQLLQEYVPQSRRLGPLASMEIVVAEGDEHGGIGANFIVEWRAEETISVPVVEALMSGIAMGQGVSFLSPGRVMSHTTP